MDLRTSTVPQASEHAHPDSAVGRNIPSLDGLRAISICLVVLAHSAWLLPLQTQKSFLMRSLIGQGIGVAVFFVISGYLITTLVLREIQKTGSLSLWQFYFRRSLRIFPPFYFFLAVVALLWVFHVIPEDPWSYLAALTYTWCYFPWAHGFLIQHSWSLSVEEQFYLLWPLALRLLHRRGELIRLGIFLILVMPLVRLAFYFAVPSIRGQQYYLIYGWIDTIMVGCLLALLKRNDRAVRWEQRYINGWTAGAMTVIGFCNLPLVQCVASRRDAGFFSLVISPTLTGICIGGTILYVTGKPLSLAGRVLNNPVLCHFGIISYSLYLWQELFLFPREGLMPWGLLYALGAAEFSYWIIERPALRLRSTTMAKIVALQHRKKTAVATLIP